jgi:hypothetical protein
LKSIFEAFGEIKEVRETPNKKHHKFIEFYDVRDAEKAMKNLNKIEPSRPGGARKGANQFPYDQYSEDEFDSQPFFQAPQSLPGQSDDFSSPYPSFTPSNHSYPPLPQVNLPKYNNNNKVNSPIGVSPHSMNGPNRLGKSPQQQQQQPQLSPNLFSNSSYPRSPPVESPFLSRNLSPSPMSAPIWNANTTKGFSTTNGTSYSITPPHTPLFGTADSIPKVSPGREKSPENEIKSKRSDAEDKSKFKLILNKVGNDDNRTTLMIKNIPNKYNQKMLLAAVDERHKGTYDFFYLPIDFKVIYFKRNLIN